MGKYDQLKFLKKTKARVNHSCSLCGHEIKSGKIYYAETVKDRFLQSLHAKKYCEACYEKNGDSLIRK
jgi:hypothetical protein